MLLFNYDEAWFHLSGYVNVQNIRHRYAENPHIIHEVQLRNQKACFPDSGRRIILPVSFYDTMNSEALSEK
jgi:hypothetical protein